MSVLVGLLTGEAVTAAVVGVIVPPGATGPGKVLPPPLVPTNGFTYAAGFWGVCAAPATATVAPGCAARKTAAHSALLPVSDHALTRATVQPLRWRGRSLAG